MARRRRVPPAGPTPAKPDPVKAETVIDASKTSDGTGTAPALPRETHGASVHDSLLETVSAGALHSHDGAAPGSLAVAMPEPEQAAAAPPVHAADVIELSAAPSPAPEHVAPVMRPAPAPAPAFRRASALDALGELSETNATVAAFLRNEGTATLAHWRSLAGAKSPADAVRLQVDEMQRAADASLSCLNTLARRVGRLAGILTRR